MNITVNVDEVTLATLVHEVSEYRQRGGEDAWSTERKLHDHGKALLDLLDKIAPKEQP
jgi:hypothetical protein